MAYQIHPHVQPQPVASSIARARSPTHSVPRQNRWQTRRRQASLPRRSAARQARAAARTESRAAAAPALPLVCRCRSPASPCPAQCACESLKDLGTSDCSEPCSNETPRTVASEPPPRRGMVPLSPCQGVAGRRPCHATAGHARRFWPGRKRSPPHRDPHHADLLALALILCISYHGASRRAAHRGGFCRRGRRAEAARVGSGGGAANPIDCTPAAQATSGAVPQARAPAGGLAET